MPFSGTRRPTYSTSGASLGDAGRVPPCGALGLVHLAPEEVGLHGLRCDEHVAVAPAPLRDVARDVLAVGQHRVGVPVHAPHERERRDVGGRQRVAPHRGPQDEGAFGAARSEPRRGQRGAARDLGRHRAMVTAQRGCVALMAQHVGRERRLGDLPLQLPVVVGDIAALSAEAEDLHAVPLGEQPVQRRAVGGDVVGDERDGHAGLGLILPGSE